MQNLPLKIIDPSVRYPLIRLLGKKDESEDVTENESDLDTVLLIYSPRSQGYGPTSICGTEAPSSPFRRVHIKMNEGFVTKQKI